MPRYGLYQKKNGEWYYAAGLTLTAAKASATRTLNLFGHPLEFKIEMDGKPWLTGKSIKPRSGEARVEWREAF